MKEGNDGVVTATAASGIDTMYSFGMEGVHTITNRLNEAA